MKRILNFLTLITILYTAISIFNIYNVFSYVLLFSLIGVAIFLLNDKKLLSANMLFYIFYSYAVAIGPIILFFENDSANFNFNFITIILGGLLAFCWGNYIGIVNKTDIKPTKDVLPIQIPISRINILRVMFILSICVTLFYVYKSYDLLFGGNMSAGRVAAQSGSGLLVYTSQLPVLIIPMMYDEYFEINKNKKRLIELISLTALACFLLLISGFRAPILTMLICIVISFVHKYNIKNKHIIGVGVIFFLLVEGLQIIRYSLSGIVGGDIILHSLRASIIVGCVNLRYIFRAFPSIIPFQNGYTYLINLIMLKPGPDLDFTLWLKQQLNLVYDGGGVTPTILGEFYINFGMISIFIGMFLLGIVGVYVYRYFKRHNQTFLGVFYIWQFAHCASGGITNVMITVILYTIIYWFLMIFPSKVEKGELKSWLKISL